MTRKPMIGVVEKEDLLERLAFAQEEVEGAALEQAKLFMAAATYRVSKMRVRQEAEMHLDNLRVDYSLKMRLKYKGQKGWTEKAINEMVERTSDIRTAVAAVAKAKRLEEWAKLLLDAYEHRRSSLKILTQFAFMQDTFSGQSEVDKMRRKRDRLRRTSDMDES
jgi:hypothetical protein